MLKNYAQIDNQNRKNSDILNVVQIKPGINVQKDNSKDVLLTEFGKALDTFLGITTPLAYSSLPWTWFAMVATLAQGLAISFLASALWMRGRPYTIFGPVAVILFGIIVGVGAVKIDLILIGLHIQTSKNILFGIIGFFLCMILGYFSSLLIVDDFDVSVVEKGDLFKKS